MQKPLVIVTGKNGQLGWELTQLAATKENEFNFLFAGRDELDLAHPETISSFFEQYRPSYFINCAAYTAVDKAETEKELAYKINATAVGMIAEQCKLHKCTLINISTDYVFDGNGQSPYKTGSTTDPVNYYGYTKLEGEKLAMANNPETVVIRTSWVYSRHGNNFVKTMLRLMKEKSQVRVVNDQTGCPTYAADLASAILDIISSFEKGNRRYGIYHYSNAGVTTWFDFANAIRNEAGLPCEVLPIPASSYPTPARRPGYSVMDTSSIVSDFGIQLSNWQASLHACLLHH